jgi:hypothetical protein
MPNEDIAEKIIAVNARRGHHVSSVWLKETLAQYGLQFTVWSAVFTGIRGILNPEWRSRQDKITWMVLDLLNDTHESIELVLATLPAEFQGDVLVLTKNKDKCLERPRVTFLSHDSTAPGWSVVKHIFQAETGKPLYDPVQTQAAARLLIELVSRTGLIPGKSCSTYADYLETLGFDATTRAHIRLGLFIPND